MSSPLKLQAQPKQSESAEGAPAQGDLHEASDASLSSFSLSYESDSGNSSERRYLMAALRPNKESKDKTEQRISASSRVNFNHLNEAEQVARYKNTRIEYFALKEKMAEFDRAQEQRGNKRERASRKRKGKKIKEDAPLIETNKKLREESYEEIPDCGRVLENLGECLATGAMKTDSLEFGMLCNLVRKVKMHTSQSEGLSHKSKANCFLKQSNREQLVHFMKGGESSQHNNSQKVQVSRSSGLGLRGGVSTRAKSGERVRANISGRKVKILQKE